CAVVATPDELRGQRPVAYVVPDPEVECAPSAEEIVARVNEVLGRWIGLKEVHFVRHLPTTVSGKITRKRLLVS
ncbi:AMP-binding enzyme, partial [Komagataeibacter rhaeticus]|uniref:AMP-binding enzyme n=1 Tax=Komagataeibacter rhaeticus TaxID=215221 RepID=UPI001A3D0F00|nr:acyl--CoA ligase [Komagataeibacter rhaeticus]